MSAYLTLEEFKYTAELTGFAFADNDARQAILAASDGIDQYCGRSFGTTAAGVNRWYSPTNSRLLVIDDAVSVSTVSVDYTTSGTFSTVWVENRDFVLQPFNAVADGEPFEQIEAVGWTPLWFPRWPRSVQVTGQWGWPAVPSQVKQATSILTTRLLKRAREAPFGIVGTNSIDAQPIRISRTDPDVAFLLDNLIKGSSGKGGVLIA